MRMKENIYTIWALYCIAINWTEKGSSPLTKTSNIGRKD